MLVLGQDEKVIRDWKYAEIKQGENSLGKSLTVTNKRIIVSEQSQHCVNRNEIELNKIVGLNTHYTTMTEDKKKKGIILLIIGAVISVLSVSVAAATKAWGLLGLLAVGLIIVAVGISCLLYKKMYGQLNVIFQTIIPAYTMRYGLSASVLPDTATSKSNEEIYIQVNLDVARDIVETLGAVILVK